MSSSHTDLVKLNDSLSGWQGFDDVLNELVLPLEIM